jgi:hypothetical protein
MSTPAGFSTVQHLVFDQEKRERKQVTSSLTERPLVNAPTAESRFAFLNQVPLVAPFDPANSRAADDMYHSGDEITQPKPKKGRSKAANEISSDSSSSESDSDEEEENVDDSDLEVPNYKWAAFPNTCLLCSSDDDDDDEEEKKVEEDLYTKFNMDNFSLIKISDINKEIKKTNPDFRPITEDNEDPTEDEDEDLGIEGLKVFTETLEYSRKPDTLDIPKGKYFPVQLRVVYQIVADDTPDLVIKLRLDVVNHKGDERTITLIENSKGRMQIEEDPGNADVHLSELPHLLVHGDQTLYDMTHVIKVVIPAVKQHFKDTVELYREFDEKQNNKRKSVIGQIAANCNNNKRIKFN